MPTSSASVLYVLLPLSILGALILVWQGTPQNLEPYVAAATIEGGEQVLAQGPAASQIAIKQLGTNGGGFFNVNSAHPYENPTPLSNLLEMVYILADPGGLLLHLRQDGARPPPGLGDLRRHGGPLRRWAGRCLCGRAGRQSVACGSADRRLARLHGGQGSPLRRRQLGDLGERRPQRPRTARSTPCTTASPRSAASS